MSLPLVSTVKSNTIFKIGNRDAHVGYVPEPSCSLKLGWHLRLLVARGGNDVSRRDIVPRLCTAWHSSGQRSVNVMASHGSSWQRQKISKDLENLSRRPELETLREGPLDRSSSTSVLLEPLRDTSGLGWPQIWLPTKISRRVAPLPTCSSVPCRCITVFLEVVVTCLVVPRGLTTSVRDGLELSTFDFSLSLLLIF